MAWMPLILLDRCRVGTGTFVAVGERELAVFRFTEPDRVMVTDNACPHAGGNLSAGEVSGGVVTCPWHQWPFDLATGICTQSGDARVRTYRTEIRAGEIWIELGRD